MRERNEDGALRAAGLDHFAAGLLQLVVAELELDWPDDRDRGHGDAGQHLLRVREGLEVDTGHLAVQAERLLASLDRGGIVLAGPFLDRHGGELISDVDGRDALRGKLRTPGKRHCGILCGA